MHAGRIAVVLALLLLQGSSAPGVEGNACIVISIDNEASREVVEAFEASFPGAARRVVVPEGSPRNALRRISSEECSVCVALGTQALELCAQLPEERPLLFAMVLDPESVLDGRANAGGVAMMPPARQELEALSEMAPGVVEVLTIYSEERSAERVSQGQEAAEQLGLRLTALRAESPEEAARLLRDNKDEFDAFWMLPDRGVLSSQLLKYLLLISYQHHAPVVAVTEPMVEKGFLFCLSPVGGEVGTLLGELAGEVAQGESPRLVRPTRPELTVNQKTAEKIGVEVPRRYLAEARMVN